MNNLAVTDLSMATAFVSWTTDQMTTGNKIEVTSADSVWQVSDNYFQPTYAHLAQVTGLLPATEYSYRIISGESSWDNGGEAFKFTTLDTISVSGPRTVWGKLQNSWGSPVARCLVRYRLMREDGLLSLPRGVITNNEGTWIGDAGIMYDENGKAYDAFGREKLITEYTVNYWTTVVDSTKEVGSGTNYNFGTESFQVTDPNVADPGDVDGNGALNIFDLLNLLKVIGKKVTPDPRMQAASDVDNNGKIDIFDLLALLKKLKPANTVRS